MRVAPPPRDDRRHAQREVLAAHAREPGVLEERARTRRATGSPPCSRRGTRRRRGRPRRGRRRRAGRTRAYAAWNARVASARRAEELERDEDAAGREHAPDLARAARAGRRGCARRSRTRRRRTRRRAKGSASASADDHLGARRLGAPGSSIAAEKSAATTRSRGRARREQRGEVHRAGAEVERRARVGAPRELARRRASARRRRCPAERTRLSRS